MLAGAAALETVAYWVTNVVYCAGEGAEKKVGAACDEVGTPLSLVSIVWTGELVYAAGGPWSLVIIAMLIVLALALVAGAAAVPLAAGTLELPKHAPN